MSFIKMPSKGKNGRSAGVNGKTRNTISKVEFFRIAVSCNGDVRKMSLEENLNQPVAAVKGRYQNLLKNDFTYLNNKLPPMQYESKRTHVKIDKSTLMEIAKLWQKSGGDEEFVAEKIGCSIATVKSKINTLDDSFMGIYHKKLIEEMRDDGWENLTSEELVEYNEKLAEDAWAQIEEEGYESPLCPRKEKSRGRASAKLDQDTINSITNLLSTIKVPEPESSDKESFMADINEMLEGMEEQEEDTATE